MAGQALVALAGVRWLPPMAEWYSGLIAYPILLPAQVAVIAILGKVCVDFTRGRGYSVQSRAWFGREALWFGYLYLAVMVARYGVRMLLVPEARWFGGTIPILFHWVLALFVILFGRFHRRRLAGLLVE